MSLAGSFYNFGAGTRPGRVIVLLGVEPDDIEQLGCRSLDMPARVTTPLGVEEERDVPVVVCREPSITIQEIWRRNRPGWG